MKGKTQMKRCCDICEIGTVALPAFGAGVLLTMFFPPCVMCGICAVAAVGYGVACFIFR